MQITPRLSVSGPDSAGCYGLSIYSEPAGDASIRMTTHAVLSRAEADALIAALKSEPAQGQTATFGPWYSDTFATLNPWRNIASAPKDGRLILISYDTAIGPRVTIGSPALQEMWACDMGLVQPTHWMPLPTAPPSINPATGAL